MGSRAQGATEYLVLLAVVLVIALVGIALLGFFPGTASDAQLQESRIYWQSASPIAVMDASARASIAGGNTYPYVLVRNTGNYPLRLTGLVGADGGKITAFSGNGNCGEKPWGSFNISDYYYLAPGEEKYFAPNDMAYGVSCNRYIVFGTSSSSGITVGGASSVCQNSTASPGTVSFSSIGFEYIQYVENQQITKRQLGKRLALKCMEPA